MNNGKQKTQVSTAIAYAVLGGTTIAILAYLASSSPDNERRRRLTLERIRKGEMLPQV